MSNKRILLVTWDGGGNVAPELQLAKALVNRGHEVRVLADPTVEAEARAFGFEFSPWRTAPHRTTRDKSGDIVKDYEIKNPIKMLEVYLREFLAGPAPRWAADTDAVLEEHPADMVIADFALPASLIAAERRGLPTCTIMPNAWIVPTPGIPPMGPGFMPAKTFLGRLRDYIFYTLTRRAFAKALPALNGARERFGLRPFDDVYDQLLAADQILVQTSPVFDFTSPRMPKHMRYVGPALGDPEWTAQQPTHEGPKAWRANFKPDDRRPLILVGLSSTYQAQLPLLQGLVRVLSQLDVRVVVTLGPALSCEALPSSDNIMVLQSAPHSEILREAALLITHCGHGTTIKGLAAGVPLLCIPMGRDQADNAARVVHAGAGLRLSTSSNERTLRQSVQRLLSEPSFKHNAQRLQHAIHTGEGCVDPVVSLETAMNQRASFVHNPSVERNSSYSAKSSARAV